MSSTSIFSHTQSSYCDHVYDQFGKGRQHAAILYSQFFRCGVMDGRDPAFANAPRLLEDILALTDRSPMQLVREHEADGTTKILFKTHDDLEVETVAIPMMRGATLCVSSQVGCRMGCTFCETGRMGLLRSLSVEEIISQVYAARFVLGCEFRNIVFMGMGEPLDNWENVSQAIRILTDTAGLCFSKNRITVSTSGCVDGIYRMIEAGEPYVNLAVSLSAPNDELRNRLMPINRRFGLGSIKRVIQDYNALTGRSIMVAYVLIRDFNDSLDCAKQLAAYLDGLDVKVNLIPYNAQSRDRFQAALPEVIDAFAEALRERGLRTLLRHNKGRDIMAACGQLGNLELRKQRQRILERSTV